MPRIVQNDNHGVSNRNRSVRVDSEHQQLRGADNIALAEASDLVQGGLDEIRIVWEVCGNPNPADVVVPA